MCIDGKVYKYVRHCHRCRLQSQNLKHKSLEHEAGVVTTQQQLLVFIYLRDFMSPSHHHRNKRFGQNYVAETS
jgi:hypothetical protein